MIRNALLSTHVGFAFTSGGCNGGVDTEEEHMVPPVASNSIQLAGGFVLTIGGEPLEQPRFPYVRSSLATAGFAMRVAALMR